MTYDVNQNDAETADGWRKNLKKGHSWNRRTSKIMNYVFFRQTRKFQARFFVCQKYWKNAEIKETANSYICSKLQNHW